MQTPLSLYIHFPWCVKKCPYCDFNSHVLPAQNREASYIDSLVIDFQNDLQRYPTDRPLHSIFIGGGTPSLFSVEGLRRLLQELKSGIEFSENIEITLEANPGTVEASKFKAFREIGINRLSIGIQSFHDEQLSALGRIHSAQEARNAVETALTSGFDNINLDLMFGLPENKTHSSLDDLQCAIAFKPAHISFYQMTLEPNTLFHRYPPRLPDDEIIFEQQLECQKLLSSKGYQQYEVSAYSKPGKACRHNLTYWEFGDYIGIGAGAHGKISLSQTGNIIRNVKHRHPQEYMQQQDKTSSTRTLSPQELPLEFLMNQLRLKKGFRLQDFTLKTGLRHEILTEKLERCVTQKLLEIDGQYYRCTERGFLFLDSILENFVA